MALRKVEGLLADEAEVKVIAREPNQAISKLAESKSIELAHREYEDGEAAHFALVFAATDDREVNRRVFLDAKGAGRWVNVADDPEHCTFHLPARLRRGPLQLIIASGGEAPFIVRRLRQLLEQKFGPEWEAWVGAAANFRNDVRRAKLNRAEQEELYDTFFEHSVDRERFWASVPTQDEQKTWLEAKTISDAGERRVEQGTAEREPVPKREDANAQLFCDDCASRTTAKRSTGFVSLVGSGPGDAGLMTLRGRARLMEADAVVCDRLAVTALPTDLPPKVELHWVGKTAGHHPMPQEEINALLVRLAEEGKRVVRLKGGDPYVFGRGGEEVQVLESAGVRYEVIPCVTAAIAVPTYAGIPVTFRREVVRVTMVTAHESAKEEGPQVRWDLLAKDPHATVLGYMGVTSLPQVTKRLLEHGMNPLTPAAMIERGTTSSQRTVISTLESLPEEIEKAGLKPPGLFAIGPTVRHADQFDWFTKRALFGRRVVMPAPRAMAGQMLELNGAELVEIPLPLTPAARIVMSALPLTDCVIKTAKQVDVLDEERSGPAWGPEMDVWCLSPDAAARARELGWQHVEHVQDSGTGVELSRAMRDSHRH